MDKGSRSQFVFCLHLVLLVVMSASAARPFTVDDAGTVESGIFELEAACDYWKNSAVATIGLKHGITERMDLGIGIGYIPAPSDEKKFTGADVGLKFALIPDLFSVSFGATFGEPAYNITAIMSKSFGSVNIDLNLGYEAEASVKDADLFYGAAIVYEFKRLGAGVEFSGTEEKIDWWQIGARFAITDWMKFDAGIGGDFNQNPSLTATTGLWFTFPLSNNKVEKESK
jgi:hypothetical protein